MLAIGLQKRIDRDPSGGSDTMKLKMQRESNRSNTGCADNEHKATNVDRICSCPSKMHICGDATFTNGAGGQAIMEILTIIRALDLCKSSENFLTERT